MGKEDHGSFTDSQLLAKLVSEVASLSAAVQKLQQGVQQASQQTTNASTLADLVSKVATSSSRDTDVNAEEAMKSYSPIWGLNGKLVFANELAGLINARNQYDNAAIQIVQDAIENARRWNSQVYSAFGERNTINLKVLSDTVGTRTVDNDANK